MIIVGLPFTGKTSAWKMLGQTLSHLHSIFPSVMNPVDQNFNSITAVMFIPSAFAVFVVGVSNKKLHFICYKVCN